jgi:hypothetical protein
VVLDLQGMNEGASGKMELVGIGGNLLRTASFSSNGQYHLSLEDLSSGVYFFRIVSGDQVITRKLLKK